MAPKFVVPYRLSGKRGKNDAAAADRIIFMDEGQIVEEGTPEAFFAAPKTDRGQNFLAKILGH